MAGNNSSDDDILNRYLEGKSELSDQYHTAASESPPRHLDRAVLTAARKAVGARRHIAFSPFASDWHIPVSLAAVLILSVAVVVIMRNESSMPPLEESLQQNSPQAQKNLQDKKHAGTPAAKTATPAVEQSIQSLEPSPASTLTESAAGKPVPETGTAILRSTRVETATVPEFDALFIPEQGSKPGGRSTEQIAGDVEGTVSRPHPANSERGESTAQRRVAPDMLKTPLPVPTTGEYKAAAPGSTAAVSGSREQRSGDRNGPLRQFIKALTGPWSGTAVTTPVGPVDYDITFRPVAGDCISGTAHPGTNHTWTFCISDKGLVLDFLTDFRGNNTPIHFQQSAYNDDVYTFKAATHKFMEVLVFAGETSAWMKIFHYGKLHVEIQLRRK